MKRYVPDGTPESLTYPEGPLGAVLAGSARRYADRVALRDGELTFTYDELYDSALRIAQALRERGVRRGETVALHQPNSAWFTVTYFGILLAGAVVTPVNPALPPLALRDQLEEASTVAVFTHPSTRATLDEAEIAGLRLTVLVPASDAAPAPADADLSGTPLDELLKTAPGEPEGVSGDDVAHLSFTGGTTGRSKAVRVLHRNLVANVLQMGSWRAAARPVCDEPGYIHLEHIPEARTPHTLAIGESTAVALAPMFHAMGLVSQSVSVATGLTVVIAGRFDPRKFVRLVEEQGVNTLPGSPALFHSLLALPGIEDADLSSVKLVNSGAAPIDTNALKQLHGLFPNACIVEGYGLTEATMALTTHPLLRDNPVPLGSVGAPLFDTELEIRELGCGPVVPTGGTGEVWARGPQITDGYAGHPDLTAEQFQDGWLRTGDIGRFDEDGWLYLVGRAKDMLIYKGYNVYPGPLEELLSQHPAVASASVIGALHAAAGEIPVAYVVARPGHAAGAELARELTEFVAARVAPYQRVREIHFIEALPVSAAGKILKTELRQRHTVSLLQD
ncbi:class I adenylate-forming enzyme family protein [Streptomyces sp. NPDC059262]|uniref:class I adenylate-forming enzyme family protein n=1 Tax=Streptomyces sp. NPDC059262 TaxID=3346797 RepID=UPI0036D0ADCE